MSAIFPKLEGLDSLSRRDGIDIRPTLVRVLTDLYVQKPTHSAEEERHYTELVLRLIDAVDVTTRVAIARKIAAYPGAPIAVTRHLARDVIEVAEPILRQSNALTSSELETIAKESGWRHAAVIATRREAAPMLPVAPSSEPLRNASAERTADDAVSLAELFFTADAAGRRVLLMSLGSGEGEPPQSVLPVETLRALEAAALGRDRAGFLKLIENALSLTPAQAERFVADPSGEPLLIALKALAMPPVAVQRVLMFVDPAIGESVQRFFELAALYERIGTDAAHKIIASVRGVEPAAKTAARRGAHRPTYYDDETARSRRGAPTRRPATTAEPQAPERPAAPQRQRTT